MAYFWVNHKQTVKQERTGRYLWSPFRNSNGAQNKTYDSMATAQAGDVVFSYANALVGAIGTVTAQARKAPKPAEFGKAGENWGNDGWLLPVVFESIVTPLRPKAHMEVLGPLFPSVVLHN